MKKTLFLIMVIMSIFRISAVAQDDPFDPVIKAFKASDASALSTLLNVTVELRLPDNENTYSESQAEMILKDFFKKHPSDSFNILEKGATDSVSKFAIGDYSSGTVHFQVYICMKEEKGKFLIHNIRIDERK